MSAGALRSTRLADAASESGDSAGRRPANRPAARTVACSVLSCSFSKRRRCCAPRADPGAVERAGQLGPGAYRACGYPVDDQRSRRPRIARQASTGAAWRQMDLATMRTQQAVAIYFVGRRVSLWTCLFFKARTGLFNGRLNRPSNHIPNGPTRPPTRPNRRTLHCCLSSRCRTGQPPAGAPDTRPLPGPDTTRTT
jgi:hypothetical protein